MARNLARVPDIILGFSLIGRARVRYGATKHSCCLLLKVGLATVACGGSKNNATWRGSHRRRPYGLLYPRETVGCDSAVRHAGARMSITEFEEPTCGRLAGAGNHSSNDAAGELSVQAGGFRNFMVTMSRGRISHPSRHCSKVSQAADQWAGNHANGQFRREAPPLITG